MLRYEIKNIYGFPEEELKRCFYSMCKSRKLKVNGFKEESLKRRTLAGEYLARKILSEETGMSPEYFDISPDVNGKLHIKNHDGLYFNVSHSGNLVAVALSDVEVGIDLELIRQISPKVAKKVCNENELQYIFGSMPSGNDFNNDCDRETAIRFFEIWTLKEAYLKCTGDGIRNLASLKAVDTNFPKVKEITEEYVLHIVKKSDIL